MFLKDLIEINQKGIIANSVNFGLMDNPQVNRHLCEGFIFNYNSEQPEQSTVGILEAVCRSYTSRETPNVHLIIQPYGQGKSHYAVAIANYFKQSPNTSEVQGIFEQIQTATAGKPQGILEKLKVFKLKYSEQHLVICLSGDRGGDLKKQFLESVIKSLEAAGIQNSLAQQLCQEPLEYLQQLSRTDQQKADQYLAEMGYPDGDLNHLISLLQTHHSAVIKTVKKIAHYLTGFTPDFTTHIDIEVILTDLINHYCSGENRQFRGILILFDELHYYLMSWVADPIGAGGTALQNITNICEQYRDKIALLIFTQIHPNQVTGLPNETQESYLKLSSRLAPKTSTYDRLTSSLELVLSQLIIQKTNTQHWFNFNQAWSTRLLSEARITYEKYSQSYQNKGWKFEKFYQCLGLGCFPLHPITAYLLCHLSFAQDRTVIQFIQGYVAEFIQTQAVEMNQQLNYIYPIDLIDNFSENFVNDPLYNAYEKGRDLVNSSDDPAQELKVLKAIFLHSACSQWLIKPDSQEHQDLLSSLTGLEKPQLQQALHQLEKTRDLIYYRPETKLYRFYQGISPKGIEEEIEEELKHQDPDFEDLVKYNNQEDQIKYFLTNPMITAMQFVRDNSLVSDDWQFEQKFYSITKLIEALKSERTLINLEKQGILAYVLAENAKQLRDFKEQIEKFLLTSPHRQNIAIAIPKTTISELARVLQKIKTLRNKPVNDKHLFRTPYEQLMQRWQDQLKVQLKDSLKSYTYYCINLEEISESDRNDPKAIISYLLKTQYSCVIPLAGQDKLRSNHSTGSKICEFVAKQLLSDHFTPQSLPDRSYKTIIEQTFINSWGLFKLSSQTYTVQIPTQKNVKLAWDKISELTDIQNSSEKRISLSTIWKVLSSPPFGCNHYIFTVLITAWMVYHQREITLKGVLELKSSASYQTQPLKKWSEYDLFKPKNFVEKWIVQFKAELIRKPPIKTPELPKDYQEAQDYLEQVQEFLNTLEPTSQEFKLVSQDQQRIQTQVKKIQTWFKPVELLEQIQEPASLIQLCEIYPSLRQPLPKTEIQLTLEQQKHNQTLQWVTDKIEELINLRCQESEVLKTKIDCQQYQQDIEQIIIKVEKIPAFSGGSFIEHLRQSQQLAQRRQRELEAVEKDLEILKNLELKIQQSQSLASYSQLLHEIRQTSYSQWLQPQIREREDQVCQQINLYHQELTTFEQQITDVSDKRSAEQLQEIILQKALHYAESELTERYETLKYNIRNIIELLTLAQPQAKQTLSGCEDLLNQLNDWQKQHDSLNPVLQNQLKLIYQDVEKTKQNLYQQQQQAAESWVNLLETEVPKLYQLWEDQQKLDAANQLVKKIEREKSDYLNFLEQNQIKRVQKIEQACQTIQDENKTTQIISLFRQLPLLQRHHVYEQLKQYLSESKSDD